MNVRDGREWTVRAWEDLLGREGFWCQPCRVRTPVACLVLVGREAVLRCEGCAALLAMGESWLAHVARRVPRPRQSPTPECSPTDHSWCPSCDA